MWAVAQGVDAANKGGPEYILLTDADVVTELYLWCLARHPKEAEVKVGLEFIKLYGEKRTEALQDFAWALLNSKDFLLTH